jgi:aromatic ring-opening dioxygenase LigB subunit
VATHQSQPLVKAIKQPQDQLKELALTTVVQGHQIAMARLVAIVVKAQLADNRETNVVVDIHNVVVALPLLYSPTE